MSKRQCKIEDCIKIVVAQDLCGMHYRRNRLYGDPLGGQAFQPAKPSRLCSIDGCGRVHLARGLCYAHTARLKRHGDPLGGRASEPLGISATSSPCNETECTAEAKARGLCWSHLNRYRYEQDPESWGRYARERRARVRGARIERFTSRQVFERDDWVCALCAEAIDPALSHPDPDSASLDHIVPISKGGDHSLANTQAAHLLCNLRKGVRVDEPA